MTQSAISMQIKRLETSLELSVFDRTSQGMKMTAAGDQLLHYAKNILAMNDEAWSRLTASEYEGEISLGVPEDIINPYVPQILRSFSRDYTRLQIKLHSSLTKRLLDEFKKGMHDVVLTTEREPGKDGEVLSTQRLVWSGATNGTAWKQRPLPLGFSRSCAFRKSATAMLDEHGIDWFNTVSAEYETAVLATVAADMCVHAELEDVDHGGREIIDHGGQLPELGDYSIALYHNAGVGHERSGVLSDYIRRAFA